MQAQATISNTAEKMPKGVFALCLIQGFSTLSYSVLYSTLVLYIRGKLGVPVTTANSIMGVFIAYNFALHLFGGYLGGRFTSYRAIYCLGMIAQVVGCLVLSLGSVESLYYGLGIFLTGSGLNISCLYCMLTQKFESNDTRRQTAFLWNYASMNAGFFIGFMLSGYFELKENYQTLFILSGLGNVLAFCLCLWFWKQFPDRETPFVKKNTQEKRKGLLLVLLIVCALPYILTQALHYSGLANGMVLITGAAMLLGIVFLAFQQETRSEKNKLLAFVMLASISIIFWTLYQVAPMALTHFINHNVQRETAFFLIPPQWFQNINTIIIVIGGPLLGILLSRNTAAGKKDNIPYRFFLALLLIGAAFIFLPLGILQANNQGLINPGWIVICFTLQSIGELLISPLGYSMIGAIAPVRLQGILMGTWLLCNGVGATLASYSSNFMSGNSDSTLAISTNPDFSQGFLLLGIVALAGAISVYFMLPVLTRLIHSDSDTEKNKNVPQNPDMELEA